MGRQNKTTLAKKSNTGEEVALTRQDAEIDTPILPPADFLLAINKERPDLIDWIKEETSKEASERRERTNRLDESFKQGYNRGQIFGLIMGLAGVIGGSIVAIFSSAPAAGGTIATAAIVVLAVSFLKTKIR